MFHVRDGLYFHRCDDGSVFVIVKNSAHERARVVASFHLDVHAWSSVVASMSAEGENADTWTVAIARQVPT